MTIVMLKCALQQADCGAALQLQHHKWTDTSSVAGTVIITGVAIGLTLGSSHMAAMQIHAPNQMTSDISLAAWHPFRSNGQLF